jgi:hypothetical protein
MSLALEANAPRTMAARLESGWGPVAGQPVEFTINSSVSACTAITDSSGLAQCESLANVVQVDQIKASFAGVSTTAFNDLPSEAVSKTR